MREATVHMHGQLTTWAESIYLHPLCMQAAIPLMGLCASQAHLSLCLFRVGSHVVSVRIHCRKMADFFPHRCFKQK